MVKAPISGEQTEKASLYNWPTSSRPAPVSRKVRRKRRRVNSYPLTPITLELTGFESGGRSVGRADDGRVVFVEFGIPGERVVAEITDEYPNYIEATAVMVIDPSSDRITARCEYFGRCGGCQLQHIEYDRQLDLKTEVVRDALRRVARLEQSVIDECVRDMWGMDDPWEYRNHMRFTVRRSGDVGQMQRGTHRFFRIDECKIALPDVNEILTLAQERTKNTHQLAVRIGQATGDRLIQPELQWRPGRRSGRPNSGQEYYSEVLSVPVSESIDSTGKIEGKYRVSGPAFFQVNTSQAERLAGLVIERTLEINPKTVIDAYSGVGTFSVLLAPLVDEMIAIEESKGANSDARFNLQANQNVKRVTAKVEDALEELETAPDVIIIDPPRAGILPSVTDAIIQSQVSRVIYVSCDPQTLARDLKIFAEAGFRINQLQPIDMFPQTQHIECVTTLTRG